MLTREEILSIEDYCAEHNISRIARLRELNITEGNFYRSKRAYRREDEANTQPAQFIQLSSGKYVPQTMPPSQFYKQKRLEESNKGNIAIEIQTVNGAIMRIHGELCPEHLRALIENGNV